MRQRRKPTGSFAMPRVVERRTEIRDGKEYSVTVYKPGRAEGAGSFAPTNTAPQPRAIS